MSVEKTEQNIKENIKKRIRWWESLGVKDPREKDHEENVRNFEKDIHAAIEKFCVKYFGKDDVLDQELELLMLLEKVFQKYAVKENLYP